MRESGPASGKHGSVRGVIEPVRATVAARLVSLLSLVLAGALYASYPFVLYWTGTLVYRAAVDLRWLVTGLGGVFRFWGVFVYLALVFAAAGVFLALLKPIFARPVKLREPYYVDPREAPGLYRLVGEVAAGGPNIMKGYHQLPEVTAETFDERGYLRTGDMARIDDDGHAYITGRIKEMLIVGGENVFPREIEEVLDTHPSVSASGVVGLHDPVRGEVPVAFVQLEEGAEYDKQALLDTCRERLAGYKVPREIRVLDELPRNGTGKVLRRKLADMLRDETHA